MDNEAKQKDEIEVLASIYSDEWRVDNKDEGLYHIILEDGRVQLTLLLEFPPSYPSESPPYFSIFSTSLRQPDIEDISNILQDLYLKNIGETVVFQWVEEIKEWLHKKSRILGEEEKIAGVHKYAGSPALTPGDFVSEEELNLICAQIDENVNICQAAEPAVENVNTCQAAEPILVQPARTPYFPIIHGDPITFKKSTFQGHAAVISDPKLASVFVRELMENKKIAHATHNIQAYRILKERSNTYDEDFDDDGEKQAGHRLLHLMQMMNVQNVIVVVSRWYGGVHLGPDRFRLINNAAREVLGKGNFIPSPEGKKKK